MASKRKSQSNDKEGSTNVNVSDISQMSTEEQAALLAQLMGNREVAKIAAEEHGAKVKKAAYSEKSEYTPVKAQRLAVANSLMSAMSEEYTTIQNAIAIANAKLDAFLVKYYAAYEKGCEKDNVTPGKAPKWGLADDGQVTLDWAMSREAWRPGTYVLKEDLPSEMSDIQQLLVEGAGAFSGTFTMKALKKEVGMEPGDNIAKEASGVFDKVGDTTRS